MFTNVGVRMIIVRSVCGLSIGQNAWMMFGKIGTICLCCNSVVFLGMFSTPSVLIVVVVVFLIKSSFKKKNK